MWMGGATIMADSNVIRPRTYFIKSEKILLMVQVQSGGASMQRSCIRIVWKMLILPLRTKRNSTSNLWIKKFIGVEFLLQESLRLMSSPSGMRRKVLLMMSLFISRLWWLSHQRNRQSSDHDKSLLNQHHLFICSNLKKNRKKNQITASTWSPPQSKPRSRVHPDLIHLKLLSLKILWVINRLSCLQ